MVEFMDGRFMCIVVGVFLGVSQLLQFCQLWGTITSGSCYVANSCIAFDTSHCYGYYPTLPLKLCD